MTTSPAVSASLAAFVEFYTRSEVRLASSIGMLLVVTGVSLAVGFAHPILGIVTSLIFGAIGFAVPQWASIFSRRKAFAFRHRSQ